MRKDPVQPEPRRRTSTEAAAVESWTMADAEPLCTNFGWRREGSGFVRRKLDDDDDDLSAIPPLFFCPVHPCCAI